jgi:hypothetical protein
VLHLQLHLLLLPREHLLLLLRRQLPVHLSARRRRQPRELSRRRERRSERLATQAQRRCVQRAWRLTRPSWYRDRETDARTRCAAEAMSVDSWRRDRADQGARRRARRSVLHSGSPASRHSGTSASAGASPRITTQCLLGADESVSRAGRLGWGRGRRCGRGGR